MIRKIARPMLASAFVIDGVQTVLNPASHKESADSVLKQVRAAVPRQYRSFVPKDPETAAQIVGGVKAGAASLFALGKAPRTAAGLLTATSLASLAGRNAFWDTDDEDEKSRRKAGALTDLALTGGVLLATVDTEGKPDMKWRAQNAAKSAKRNVQQALPTQSEAEKAWGKATDWFSDATDQVGDYIDDNRGDWRKAASRAGDKATDFLGDAKKQTSKFLNNAGEWLDDAADDAQGKYAELKPSKLQQLKAKHKVFDKLVYSTIRNGVGGNVNYCITGGSAMGHDLLHWYRGIGIPVYEGYGLTEVAAAAAVDFVDQSIGTVGPPMGGVTFRINEEGEICIKGDIVFHGYWNNPEATAEALEDGWYNTGDLGEIDEDGKLVITGRKKDLIVTAGGKNVSPGPMEDILRGHPLISQAMVVGDGKPFVGVLLTLDPDILKRWKLDHNIPENRSMRELATDPTLRAELQDAINQVNATVSHAEGIKKFYILESDLTEEENELTPTMKVKRNVVSQRYAAAIEHLYKR